MSVEASTWVWKHSKAANPSHLLVMLAIADFHGDNGAWPRIATLARMARTSERTVQRALTAGVRLGELTVEYGAGPHGRNLYALPAVSPRQDDGGDTGDVEGATPMALMGDTGVAPITKPKEPPVEPPEVQELAPRERDAIFEVLYLVQNGRPYEPGARLTNNERMKINAARKQVAEAGYTDAELAVAISGWPGAMGQLHITAMGLVSNVSRCLNAADGVQFRKLDRYPTVLELAKEELRAMQAAQAQRARELNR